MSLSEDFIHRELLEKGRKVRTPAGVKRYGLPIGSPIPPGGRAKALASRGLKATGNARRSHRRVRDVSDAEFKRLKRENPRAPISGGKLPKGVSETKNAPNDYNYKGPAGSFRMVRHFIPGGGPQGGDWWRVDDQTPLGGRDSMRAESKRFKTRKEAKDYATKLASGEMFTPQRIKSRQNQVKRSKAQLDARRRKYDEKLKQKKQRGSSSGSTAAQRAQLMTGGRTRPALPKPPRRRTSDVSEAEFKRLKRENPRAPISGGKLPKGVSVSRIGANQRRYKGPGGTVDTYRHFIPGDGKLGGVWWQVGRGPSSDPAKFKRFRTQAEAKAYALQWASGELGGKKKKRGKQ